MSSRIILHPFFVAVVLFLVDFEELTSQLGLKGEMRSRVTSGAPVRGQTRTCLPDSKSMSYLRKYGYLPRSDQETQALRTEGELTTAIRRFQRMAGIRETGYVDETTKAAMRRKRCGMPDVTPLEFKLGPSRWEKNQLTYKILTYTRDVSQTSVDDSVVNAMRLWSEVTPLTFQKVNNEEADLMISFGILDHGDGNVFDGTGGVLAHAFPPGEGRGGDVHFDDDETWTIGSQEGVNLFIVAAHELGHSLGLYHSDDQRSLMYPYYQGYQPSFRLSDDDIRGMQTIYGGPGRRMTVRPEYRPPTVRPTPYGPRRGVTVRPEYRTVRPIPIPPSCTERPRVAEPTPSDGSDLCSSRLDAVARIRGEIFAFSGKWYWRLKKDAVEPVERHLISLFWEGLPVYLDRIDAAFERPGGNIFFFHGTRYWEFTANTLSPGFPANGRPITDFGLPRSVDHLDAAFVWEMNQRVYLVSGDTYWRMTTSGTQTEPGYPLGMDMWNGIPLPVDAAFTHFDDRTYFIRGQEFWRLEKGQMQSTSGSPKRTSSLWTQCRNEAAMTSVNLSPSLLCLFVYAILTLYPHSLT